MESIYKNLGGVIQMPSFIGRQLYMHKIDLSNPQLPKDFCDFKDTVEQILSKVADRNNVGYVTIHEKVVNNDTHRRGGIHVDFNWYENSKTYGGGGHKTIGMHKKGDPDETPYWVQPNPFWKPPSTGTHGFKPEHFGGMLLVSNYPACKVWRGDFEGNIGEGGDCKDINIDSLESEVMPAGDVYYVNALGIHESLPIKERVNRTLIRINFHPEYLIAV